MSISKAKVLGESLFILKHNLNAAGCISAVLVSVSVCFCTSAGAICDSEATQINVSDNSSMRRILVESAGRHVSWVQAEFLEEKNSYTELCYI